MINVEADFRGLRELYHWVEDFDEKHDAFLKKFVRDAGLRALRSTKKLTPVGIYPEGSGMVGGTLRNSWKITRVIRRNNDYEVSVYADPMIAPYAPFVEHGHRIVKGLKFQLPDGSWRRTKESGWWEGYHMARDSVQKVHKNILRSHEAQFKNFVRSLGGDNG